MEHCPGAHLLVIDDGSPDGTGSIVDEIARTKPVVRIIHRPRKMGLGSAHVLGMDKAIEGNYRVLVTMDCDYTHRPEDVPRLVAGLDQNGGIDLVIGSRYHHPFGITSWPFWRRVVTRTAHTLTRALLDIPWDATNAFRAYRVDALRKVRFHEIKGEGFSFMFEMVYTCMVDGLRIDHVPVVLPIRRSGKSKISRKEVGRAVAALARLSADRVSRGSRVSPFPKEP
jgi:dolichol-phosphate mannosyltransferase